MANYVTAMPLSNRALTVESRRKHSSKQASIWNTASYVNIDQSSTAILLQEKSIMISVGDVKANQSTDSSGPAGL